MSDTVETCDQGTSPISRLCGILRNFTKGKDRVAAVQREARWRQSADIRGHVGLANIWTFILREARSQERVLRGEVTRSA